ncbi:collagen alpha-1(I) chain-like [Bombina bombina]|uniref:collagen alpha-1(I) chain-like n=1 Tax=Bombina bombina TaxID=8345 RepID=UPI00235ACC5F|nr:collagen alpha-1(I) chain-like [Bombina bombina]
MDRARRVSVPPKRFRDGSPGGYRAPAKVKRVSTVENPHPSQEDMIPCGQGSRAPSLAPPGSPSLYEGGESSGGETEVGEAVSLQEEREFEQASSPGPGSAELEASLLSSMASIQALPAEAAAGVMSLLQALVAEATHGGSAGPGPVSGPGVVVGPGPSSGPVVPGVGPSIGVSVGSGPSSGPGRPGAGLSFGPGIPVGPGPSSGPVGPGAGPSFGSGVHVPCESGPIRPGPSSGADSGGQAGASGGSSAGQGRPSAGAYPAPVQERGGGSVGPLGLAGQLRLGRPLASSSPYEVASGGGLPVAVRVSTARRSPAPSGDALPVRQTEPETPLRGLASDHGRRGKQPVGRSGSSHGTRAGKSGVPGPGTGPAGGVGGMLAAPRYEEPRVQQQGPVRGVPGDVVQGSEMPIGGGPSRTHQQGQLSRGPVSAAQMDGEVRC